MASEKACFAAGCFWGVQRYFKKQFGDAIKHSAVGYIGGSTKDPSYREVCSGRTNHAEAVLIDYDPSKVKFQDLCHFFFRIHDPTTKDRQGNDTGTQYRSAIFYYNEEQKQIAEKVKDSVADKWPRPIVTTLEPAGTWYNAEDYHQNYLDANPGGYCNHRIYW